MKRHSLIGRLCQQSHYQLRRFMSIHRYLGINVFVFLFLFNVSNITLVQAEEVVSGLELIEKAQPLVHNNPILSAELANRALKKAQQEDDLLLIAQSHQVLAKINQQSENIIQAKSHFLAAALHYEKSGAIQLQISVTFDYINLLIKEKRFLEANEKVDQLLLVVEEFGQPYLIAKSLIIKGGLYYQRKLYTKAVEQYAVAIQYLSDKDLAIQKELGDTYTKLAESYKRIKNRKLTAASYHKALVVYTELQNKKLIARTSNNLAEAERHLGHYTAALDYSLNSIEIHNIIDDPIGRAKAYNGAGIIYRHIGLYEKSLEYVYEAYQFYKKINDSNGIAKASNQMGLIYIRLKQFEQAKFFYQLTIDLSDKEVEGKVLASALRELGVIELNDKNYKKAREFVERAH